MARLRRLEADDQLGVPLLSPNNINVDFVIRRQVFSPGCRTIGGSAGRSPPGLGTGRILGWTLATLRSGLFRGGRVPWFGKVAGPIGSSETARVRQLNDGSVVFFNSEAVVQVYDLSTGVVLALCQGLQTEDFAPHIIHILRCHIIDVGHCCVMVDAEASKMMTTGFREAMTAWFRANEQVSVHMLVQSRLLEMGLSVANLAMKTPRAHAYSKREEWEAAGRRELPSFRSRPLALPEDLRNRATE